MLHLPDLPAALQSLLTQIPPGRVATYGDLGAALGNPSAARWVGEYLLDHPHGDDCPCHRVIRATGDVGLYISGDPAEKAAKLRAEGVDVSLGRAVLGRFRFADFVSDRPLERLNELQARIAEQVALTPLAADPQLVGGVDVSYVGRERAVAAYALIDAVEGRLVWSTTIEGTVKFPYIPGYLTFREAPVLLELIEQVRGQGMLAEAVLVDGTGILHPRMAGIATHFGVTANLPTIGVSKSLLCGKYDLVSLTAENPVPITYRGRVLGTALQGRPNYLPVYACPGHLIDVAGAARVVRALFHGHRLPEPTYWADALSRQAARGLR